MGKWWSILAGTQPQTSSEAVGTSQPQQQINNDTCPITVHNTGNGNVYVGSSVAGNYRNEEKEGSQKPVDVDALDCTRLKTYYKHTLCETLPLPWYTEHAWNIHEVYTELALEGSEDDKFGVDELFEQCPGRFPIGVSYRILIEGDAGYGKSTLMLKIASDWSNRDSNDKTNYTSRFSLLLVVKLGYVGEDENLLSYMESIYSEKIDKPLEDVLKCKGAEKVLILLDGYDEAKNNTKKEVDRIMKKEKMMECHVVLTSRFGHVPDAVKSKALRVTVKGFGRKQVTVAVTNFFIKAGHLSKANVEQWCKDELLTPKGARLGKSDDLPSIDDFKNVIEPTELLPKEKRLGLDQFKKFMKKVQDESPYKKLAQCPLLCVMLCCLVSECPKSELPSTFSGLYFAMINRNLYRAARKKSEAAGEDEEQWDLSKLSNHILEGHESYLREFGRLCINGLKTGSMSFRLFDITGNEKAKTTNVKVTELIKAGVLVQDFTELKKNKNIPCYQVPHRTTAEFLAAYYLSGETDQNILQQNFLGLFWLRTSFKEVAVSLIEMEKQGCLANAFRVVKFPSDFLAVNPFMERYFAQHGTWSEFKDALPSKLMTPRAGAIVSSSEPCVTLQLIEELYKMDTGNTNAPCSLLPKDCFFSLHVKDLTNLPLLQTLGKSGVVLNSLKITESISNQMQHEVARSLHELLKAGSCPIKLSFRDASPELTWAMTNAMQEVPNACLLRSFEVVEKWRRPVDKTSLKTQFYDYNDNPYNYPDTSLLWKVLAEKWLSHLEHLGISWNYKVYRSYAPSRFRLSFGILRPVLKGLGEPGCRLTSLHLYNYRYDNKKGSPLLEDLMFATKLVTLRLEIMDLRFDVTKISEYAVKEKCALKHLHLKDIRLKLKGSLPSEDKYKELLGWRNVALHLEELTIDDCIIPGELFSWLNLSVPNLRTLTIGRVLKWTPPNCNWDHGETKLLEALTLSSGESIEELSLLSGFWRSELMLHPIREALQRCPRMRKVKLDILFVGGPVSIGPARSTSLSSSDEEALKSDNICLALLKIVLSAPMLQTFKVRSIGTREEIGIFSAIADKAGKWPGNIPYNGCNTLTLHGLSNENACNAMRVFRERGLKHCLRYVSNKVYELWFPV